MTVPNYEFVGVNATQLFYRLEQLRTSAEFRAMEAVAASKYDRIVVVMAENVVPYRTPTGVNGAEVTGSLDRTQYIYIDTSTSSVKMENGVWKSMSAEQVFDCSSRWHIASKNGKPSVVGDDSSMSRR